MKRTNANLGGPMAPMALSLAVVLSVLASSVANAQAAPPAPAAAALTGFVPFSDYQLKLDGSTAPKAEIYRSTRAGAYLVIDAKLEHPLLLAVSRTAVETVNLMKMTRKPDGSIDLLPGATMGSAGSFKTEGNEVAWTALGHSARLIPRPWLVKSQTGVAMLEHDTAYQRRAAAYTLDSAIVAELKAQTKKAKVLVFFGSWCPHCQQNVPKLLQLEKALAGASIQFEYYGLPQGTGFASDPEAKKFGIQTVPTGVVLVDGIEVGRFDGASWAKIEAALRDMLKS